MTSSMTEERSAERPVAIAGPGKRIRFIDGMRGLAVLLRIAVHATDAFLSDSFRSGELWDHVNILFGFVAPAFLFFSGVTFRIALERRVASERTTRDLALRALQILALGYWLQIPSHSLRIALQGTPEQAARFFDCNILQLIGGMMLLMLALHTAFRSLRTLQWSAGGIAAAMLLFTPFVPLLIDQSAIPLPLRFWVGPAGTFPVFPFAAYFLVGVAVSQLLVSSASRRFGGAKVASAGFLLLLLSEGLDLVLSLISPYDNFWENTPALFLFRTGGVLLLSGPVLGMMRGGEERKRVSLLEKTGKASLGIYILHLMLIYGSPVNMGVRYWYDSLFHQLMDPLETAMIFLGIAGVTLSAVLLWRMLRNRKPVFARWLILAWWVGFGAVFLVV